MPCCRICEQNKEQDQFNKTGKWFRTECKVCQSKIKKEWYQKNKEHALAYKKNYEAENKDSIKQTKRAYNKKNACEISEYNKSKYYLNPEKSAKRVREYYAKNKEAQISRIVKYNINKMKTDIQYRISQRVRQRISQYIRRKNLIKPTSTIKAIGCSIKELLEYLESKFDDKMNWDNYGSYWHIDHIYPLSKLDLTNVEDFKKATHYTNLQPLEAKENLRKSNKII
jgi:hypothetical protein